MREPLSAGDVVPALIAYLDSEGLPREERTGLAFRSGVTDALGRIRDTIKRLVTSVYCRGTEAMGEYLSDAMGEIEGLLESAGDARDILEQDVLRLLNDAFTRFIELSLLGVPARISSNQGILQLSEVSLTRRALLSGSITVALTQLLEVVAKGELEITTKYVVLAGREAHVGESESGPPGTGGSAVR